MRLTEILKEDQDLNNFIAKSFISAYFFSTGFLQDEIKKEFDTVLLTTSFMLNFSLSLIL